MNLNRHTARTRSASLVVCALLAISAAPVSSLCAATDLPSPSPRFDLLAQGTAATGAPSPGAGTPPAAPVNATSWTFSTPPSAGGANWSAERGRLTYGDGNARLQPDANRRVVLLSPPALPDTVRGAEEFVLGLSGTGLQRVRIQGRRDARGGWITLADASGSALRQTAEGYVVMRKPGARSEPIERLRIEIDFGTTNPRTLQGIAAR